MIVTRSERCHSSNFGYSGLEGMFEDSCNRYESLPSSIPSWSSHLADSHASNELEGRHAQRLRKKQNNFLAAFPLSERIPFNGTRQPLSYVGEWDARHTKMSREMKDKSFFQNPVLMPRAKDFYTRRESTSRVEPPKPFRHTS